MYFLDIVNLNRCLGQLQLAYQILKEQSNKNIIDLYDILVVERLLINCLQLTEKVVERNIDRLAVDRYGVRCDIRYSVLWHTKPCGIYL